MSSNAGVEPGMLFTPAQLVHDSLTLISLPAAYIRLKEVMAKAASSMQDVAEVVSLDPSLSLRLLRIANSAYYGLPAQVDTISRAVNLLGTKQIHDLALATSVAQAFDGMPNEVMDMSTFWYRSVLCGFLAKELAKGTGLRDAESLFVRGLLHDIGHLVLYSRFPKKCRQALAEAGDDLRGLYARERKLIGCSASEVGAELMRAWRLPQSFVASFEQINRPERAGDLSREVAILHISSWLTYGMDTDLLMDQVFDQISPQIWGLTGLQPATVEEVFDDVSVEMIEAMYRLFTKGDEAG